MEIKEKILFKTLTGSKLYGTNSENSDTDIKGVFLPDIKDLLLNKAPKHYTINTNNSNERNTSEDTDETYYSLHNFLELAAKGETNAIDLLFAYTNEDAVLKTSHIWNELIKNIDKIVTKNIKSYIGFCKSQCMKYSFKGDKLNNFKKFAKFLYDQQGYYWNTGNKDTTLKNILNDAIGGDYSNWIINNHIPKVGEERKKFTAIDFGDHCYIETANNKESYLVISGVKFQLHNITKNVYNKVYDVINSYGKRAEQAAKDNGADWKAISHCVRVIYQVEELLTLNKITFPIVNADFVKSIKYKTTNLTFEEIINMVEEKIKIIDERLLPNCTLRDKADYKWIENFILNCYDYKN